MRQIKRKREREREREREIKGADRARDKNG